jgi:DNA repair exonuclease SbcCD ATPase subunit
MVDVDVIDIKNHSPRSYKLNWNCGLATSRGAKRLKCFYSSFIRSCVIYIPIISFQKCLSNSILEKEKLIARNKDIRSYSSFSGGEKKRIDLALLLALMDVSKERNSIDTNILVLDEILDTSLDTVGAESFLEHLKNGFKNTCPDKCIYIISHKKELGEETFDSIIHLTKKNGFTSIDRII